MKIIILGAGQVGGTLAENLVGENNDITLVDTNGDRLRSLQDKFDLRVVQGHGSHPRVLREAGADDADMLVAVTSSDETNMVACQVAYSLFNTPNRIARIRAPDYVRDAEKLFNSEAVPIDHLIAPEQLVIDNIHRLIEYPGALQVVDTRTAFLRLYGARETLCYEYLCETDDGQRCVIAVNARTGQQERIQTSDVSGGVQMQF